MTINTRDEVKWYYGLAFPITRALMIGGMIASLIDKSMINFFISVIGYVIFDWVGGLILHDK